MSLIRILTKDNHSGGEKPGDEEELSEQANKTFKTILLVIIVILVIFLLFFIYNLIKCYLPKWMGQDRNRLQSDENSIEFDKVEIKA